MDLYLKILQKLDDVYNKQEDILNQIQILYTQYQQLKQDEELLELSFMYDYNKKVNK